MEDVFPEVLRPYIPFINNIALALLIFIIGWVFSKWANRILLRVMDSARFDKALGRFLASIGQYTVLAATVIIALERVGVATTSLVALLASAGLAIGLALQGSLGNFASGVMILFFRPFTLGDRVTTAGHTGKVDEIGLFATTLLTPDNEKIIIPNSGVTGDSITNHTARGTLRGNISVGIAYGSDLEKSMEILIQACRRCDLVLTDPEPSAAFVGFGASSLDFVVRPWAKADDLMAMLQQVRVALYDDLNAANIEIPFNQIVVHQS